MADPVDQKVGTLHCIPALILDPGLNWEEGQNYKKENEGPTIHWLTLDF